MCENPPVFRYINVAQWIKTIVPQLCSQTWYLWFQVDCHSRRRPATQLWKRRLQDKTKSSFKLPWGPPIAHVNSVLNCDTSRAETARTVYALRLWIGFCTPGEHHENSWKMDVHPLQYGRFDSFPSDNSQEGKPVKPVKLPKPCQVATWFSKFKLLDLSDLLVVFAQIVWPQCCKDLAAVDLPPQQLR